METIYDQHLGEMKVTAETQKSIIAISQLEYVENIEWLYKKNEKNIKWWETKDKYLKFKKFYEAKELRKAELLSQLEKEFSDETI